MRLVSRRRFFYVQGICSLWCRCLQADSMRRLKARDRACTSCWDFYRPSRCSSSSPRRPSSAASSESYKHYVDFLKEELQALTLLLGLIIVSLPLGAFNAIGKYFLDPLLQLLLLLVAEHEVEFFYFHEDVALIEVVDQSEVTAGEWDLEDNSHIFEFWVPFYAALEPWDGSLLIEGVQVPVHLAALVFAAVQPFNHLRYDVFLGTTLLGFRWGEFVCREGVALLECDGWGLFGEGWA